MLNLGILALLHLQVSVTLYFVLIFLNGFIVKEKKVLITGCEGLSSTR